MSVRSVKNVYCIFGTVFSVFFASYHFVSHPKIPFCFKAKQAKLTFFLAILLHSFLLLFRFVSLPSEMRGHPSLENELKNKQTSILVPC